MTGAQAGEHGIFGFTDLLPNTYQLTFPNFTDLKIKTLFDELGEKGNRSVVINVPATYPARQIPGVLISGFVAVDIKKAVYPSTLAPKLLDMGYSIDIDVKKAREDHEFLIADLQRTLRSRERVADYLWEREDWDLFMVVITGTDRLHHLLWEAYVHPDHGHHRDFIEYYQEVDQFVGRLYGKYMDLPGSREGTNHFLMLSDHGFTSIRSEVYLNRLLWENGFLSFASDQPTVIKDISPDSRAFAMDPSRIYINMKGRYPQGSVEPKEVQEVKNEIRNLLLELRYEDGSEVIKRVYDRDELYHGPQTHRGPDLVVLSHNGFDLKGKVNSSSVYGRSALQGMHTHDDAFVFSNRTNGVKTIFELKNVILNNYAVK
jgi:predicted AlkP superfamily phosphohydrolase/phosphomutase